MSRILRVFYAHPKGMSDEEIDVFGSEIRVRIRDSELLPAGYDNVDVTPGRDDFRQYSMSAGSFTAWAREVPQRRDMSTGTRYYGAFVSTNAYVGRATADILSVALSVRTPVYYFEPDPDAQWAFRRIHDVRGIVVVDAEDYLKGWCLDT